MAVMVNTKTVTMTPVCLFCVQVKQIMEEAVTKKFVHEDSSHIIALCSKYALPYSSEQSHAHSFAAKDTAWRHRASNWDAASMES